MHPTCVTLARRQQALTVPIAESTPGVYSKPIEIHGCAHFSQCILLRVTLRRRQEASANSRTGRISHDASNVHDIGAAPKKPAHYIA
ncbi:uncharacterized protein LOC142590128 isoform X3 [Dermacentor variabilis]|uniref:uncharacterized protein LOC142590128 isoform X3 n=1 Tax=Dermacentor variabilis TaxID=34621 RepID=UPI003F5B5567